MVDTGKHWTSEDEWWVRDNLRETIDQLVAMGYTVRGGQDEDPELINPGGLAVETWREGYPYDERISREEYELEELSGTGDVGVWHETYQVPATGIEVIYNGMPIFGLAKATTHVPVRAGTNTAKQRMGRHGM